MNSMLRSEILKRKAKGKKGYLYVGMTGVDGEMMFHDGTQIPLRVALKRQANKRWVELRQMTEKYGSLPRISSDPRKNDDPDTSPERTIRNYEFMRNVVKESAVAINDVDEEGNEVWLKLVIVDDEDESRYDEEEDTLYIGIDTMDTGTTIADMSTAAIKDANYGAGIGEHPFRPYIPRTAGADVGAV